MQSWPSHQIKRNISERRERDGKTSSLINSKQSTECTCLSFSPPRPLCVGVCVCARLFVDDCHCFVLFCFIFHNINFSAFAKEARVCIFSLSCSLLLSHSRLFYCWFFCRYHCRLNGSTYAISLSFSFCLSFDLFCKRLTQTNDTLISILLHFHLLCSFCVRLCDYYVYIRDLIVREKEIECQQSNWKKKDDQQQYMLQFRLSVCASHWSSHRFKRFWLNACMIPTAFKVNTQYILQRKAEIYSSRERNCKFQ